MKTTKILILGGGFGGVEVARTLSCKVDNNASITLVSKKPYFEYYPGLYRVLSSEPPFEVFVPLKALLPKKVTFLIDEILSINLKDKTVELKNNKSLTYDIVVLGLGSEAFYFNTPGIEKYALGCKSLVDVRYLRRDLISKINRVHDANKALHVVVAGGGPTGVEMAGQLYSLFTDEARFQDVACEKLKITLVQGDPFLVPQLQSEVVSKKIKKKLEDLSISVLTDTRITEQKEDGVLTTKGAIETDTLIWTAGTQINRLLQNTPGLVLTDRKKILVDEYLKAQGCSDVYVVGDIAGVAFSGLAQTAVSHGAYVGKQIASILSKKIVSPYIPTRAPAYVMPVGRYWGIFHFKGFTLTGIIPHMMRYAVDILYFWQRLSFYNFMQLYLRGRLKQK